MRLHAAFSNLGYPPLKTRLFFLLWSHQARTCQSRSSSGSSRCIFATLARSYRDFSLDYGLQDTSGEGESTLPHSTAVENYASFQQYGLAPGQSSFLPTATHHTLQQHHSQIVQVTGVESHPTLRQSQQHLLQRQQQQLPHHQHSYGAGPSTATDTGPYRQQYGQGQTRKRSSRTEHDELQLDIQGLSSLSDVTETSSTGVPIELTPHGHHTQPQSQLYQAPPSLSTQAPQHHHHRLPNQPPSKMRRTSGYGEISSPPSQPGPSSVVGQEGMPPPAPRPRGPKLKFTPEDDQLLVDLKEKKNLTWKQIADFFPGRSSGTLQVRYCTKLKAKTTVWTDEMVCCVPGFVAITYESV